MNGIRTITLDLDDTLWEIHPVIRRAETALYDWLGANYPRLTGMFSPEDMLDLRRQVIAEMSSKSHDLTLMRRTVLLRAGEAAGYGDFRVDEAFAVFDAVRNDVTLFPEVVPALTVLRERYVLVAVTNGNANLERIGIHELFDGVVSAAMAGAAKPARPIFDAAVQVGGASAAETLHVGDHPLFDMHGAREAGLRTAWVNRNGDDWPDDYDSPDAEVRHVGELLALLENSA